MPQTTTYEKLWSRQLPQLLGTYLAVGFGVLQFVEFMTTRYGFDSTWVDRYLLLWLGMIPAVAMIIYYRGLPPANGAKAGGWKRWLLGLNTLLVAALTLSLSPGAPEPATEVVDVTDENGQSSQRVIPSSASVHRVAIFDFLNASREEGQDWKGTAFGLLLYNHLRQRPEILATSTIALNQYYDRFSEEKFSRINLATQRRIAERARTDYFVRVDFTADENGHEANGQLYRTRDGKAVQTLQGASADLYGLVDQLKAQILDYLPMVDELDNQSTDLPVSALLTDNAEALEAYVKGEIAFRLNAGELDVPAAHFRRSLELDPHCAICAYALGDKLYGMGKKDSSLLYLSQAVRLADVLPEREQFGYKSVLFNVRGEFESLAKLMESFRTLYPYEYSPYATLESYYEATYGLDSAIHLMQTAAMLSNRELALSRLFSLHLRAENFTEAENILKDLGQEFPDEDITGRRYAELYRASGQTDKARALLEDKMALDPMNMDFPNQLMQIEQTAGNYTQVEKLAKKVLRNATTQTDSTTAWNFLIQSMAGRGKIAAALEELEDYEASLSKITPKNVLVLQNYGTRSTYILRTDDYRRVYDYLEELGRYDPVRENVYRCYLPFQMIGQGLLEDDALATLNECEETLSVMGPATLQLMESFKAILNGEAGKAADLMDEFLADKQNPAEPIIYARINRLAGRHDRATEILEKELETRPNQPDLLLEYAYNLRLAGKEEPAKTALHSVLVTWSQADADYRPAREARELAGELGMEVGNPTSADAT